AEVVHLAMTGLAHEVEGGPVHRIRPRVRVHRAFPLVVDVGMTAAAQLRALELLRFQCATVGARTRGEKGIARIIDGNTRIDVRGVVRIRHYAEGPLFAPT